MFPFLVIDQNQLRRTHAIDEAVSRCQEDGLQILIPDGAGFEMSKSSAVFDTWRNSLELLCAYSDQIVVSSKLPDLMRAEIDTGHSVRGIVDHGATTIFRGILADLGSDDQSSLRQIVDGPIREKMPTSIDAWSDLETNKNMIVTMRNALMKTLSDQEVKLLRRSPDSELATWLSSVNGVRFAFQGIVSRGVNEVVAVRLAASPSVTGAFITSLAAVALYWLAFGGLETANASNVTNDLHDVEYAVLGSLSVELISADKRLQAIQKAVKSAQHYRHNWFKEQQTVLS